jgi:uncharacterized protein (TIGR03437 family)
MGCGGGQLRQLLFTDSGNGRIRKVDARGIITTVAGDGAKDPGENVAATSTKLGNPVGLAIDSSGTLYVAEVDNNRVRKVTTSGNIVTIAGNGKQGFAGDGGPATSAMLNNPHGVGVDSAGNVYIADTNNFRVRKVDPSGVIATVAGNGQVSNTKDGVAGTSTTLTSPWDAKVDAAGNLFIAEWIGFRIRKVDTRGIISTVAGTGTGGYSGDGGAATSANLQGPAGIALDAAGSIYIADSLGNRVRKVSAAALPPPSITSNGVVNGASFQPGLVAGSWATVQGSNLAAVVDNWNNFIVNGKLPTTFDGVKVTIGGSPAYLSYISPTQINLVVPPDAGTGPNQVIVTTSAGASAAYAVTVNAYGPAFFPWPGGQAVATRQDFSYAVKNGTFPGVATVAAKPGDVVILWGTGFGPTIPAVPPGLQVPSTVTYSTSTPPVVTINGISAIVYGAALAPGYAGLYQVAIQVPPGLADGDWPLKATIGGVASHSGVVLSVLH